MQGGAGDFGSHGDTLQFAHGVCAENVQVGASDGKARRLTHREDVAVL